MRAVWVGAVALGVIALDQLTKFWAIGVLSTAGMTRVDLMPFVDVVYALNTGVNFGLFASDSPHQPLFLAAIAGAVSVALSIWAIRTDDWRVAAGAAVLIGGAIGNAYDRLTVGAVIDFINMDCCGIGNPFAFNVADTAIFVGALLILWATWRENPAEDAPTGEDAGQAGRSD